MEITNSNPEKIKDPRRVEAGKRLAAISKAAKAKKRHDQEQQVTEEPTCESSTTTTTGFFIGAISVITGVGALYFAYKQYSLDRATKPVSDVRPERSERNKNVIMNEVFDTLLYVIAGVGISFTSKKILGKSLGTPTDPMGIFKLVGAVTAGTVAVKYAQQQKLIPVAPFK